MIPMMKMVSESVRFITCVFVAVSISCAVIFVAMSPNMSVNIG